MLLAAGQVLYERFFASDPVDPGAGAGFDLSEKDVMDRVLEFLGRDDEW